MEILVSFLLLDHGSILKCIIESERISVITLDKIFRQAAESKIILNAHRVNSGEGFIEDKSGKLNNDFFFVEEGNRRANYEICAFFIQRWA